MCTNHTNVSWLQKRYIIENSQMTEQKVDWGYFCVLVLVFLSGLRQVSVTGTQLSHLEMKGFGLRRDLVFTACFPIRDSLKYTQRLKHSKATPKKSNIIAVQSQSMLYNVSWHLWKHSQSSLLGWPSACIWME